MYAVAQSPLFRPLPGLGAATAVQEGTAIGGAVGSSTVATLVATGAIAGPVGAAIGAGIALVATLINALGIGKGCGQTCIETSQWANQAEVLLQQNVKAYFAQPAPRSQASQTAALANFQTVWNNLVQLCTQPNLGTAGQNCIGDRQQGACKWKMTAAMQLGVPGEPAIGDCANWFNRYQAPIQNDTEVVEDSSSALAQGAADTSASVVSSSGLGSLSIPLLIALAVLGVWWVVS